MTIAAVWRVHERVYAAADSRISRSQGNVLTEHGPKLLPIPLVCKEFDSDGRVVHSTVFGYAYAGATLPAMATQALATTLCSNLIGPPGSSAPSLGDVSQIIADIARHYMSEVGQLNGATALFSAIVFGWCLAEKRFRAFQITPLLIEKRLRIELNEQNLDRSENLLVIGSCPNLLQERVKRERQNHIAEATTPEQIALMEIDLPRRALEFLITEHADPFVGGCAPVRLGNPIRVYARLNLHSWRRTYSSWF
jgi:hypothetical protein